MAKRFLKVVLLSILSLGLSASADAVAKHNPFPGVRLHKRELRGTEAVKAITPHIGRISKHYKTTESKLKKALLEDSSLRVDERGLLFFSEDITLSDGSVFNPSPDLLPDAETFKLHSRNNPSGGTIYLSFLGTTVMNTAWNYAGPIVAAPYSHDADPAFNAAELREIRAIWLRIAEDYAAFNIDVTTERPLNPTPGKFTEVIFTPSSEWYGSAGGVAFIGSYTWSDMSPCWVFSTLLNNNTKYISEAGSHEVGHTLGLYHWSKYDPSSGVKTSEYHFGSGNWAPIMGVGYYRPITTWSKGEYSGAGTSYGMSHLQDDLQVISGITGFAPDEAPSSLNSTIRLSRYTDATGMHILHRGLITASTDTDVYRMDTLGGAIHLSVDPAIVSSNLDFRVRLYNSSGTIIQESDPYEVSAAYIDLTNSDPGTYYLEVKPVGTGDPLVTGYSSYGSTGQYYISGTYAAASSDEGGGPTPTPQPTATPTPQPTATPTPQPTATPTPQPTATPTPQPTATPTPTPELNPAPTANITSPTPYKEIKRGKKFDITVRATDNSRVQNVVIKMGNSTVCSKNVNAESVEVKCSKKAPQQTGYVTLTSIVTDDQGKSTTSPWVIILVTH